jgi:acetylornithine deacetylase/succinyl-diaminopimelate desuccinylase-like protein
MALDPEAVVARTRTTWDAHIQPTLEDYIRVPALSVAFDPDWAEHGHLDAVVDDAAAWAARRSIAGLSVEVVRLPGRTPVLWFEVPPFDGTAPSADDAPDVDTVLLYGHLDKQPPMHGWREGLGPWTPVLDGDRLYGRGGADDGYAAYASLAAIEAVQAEGGRHARCIGLIESSEESGSPDLPAYVAHLASRIGSPSLVVCLDSFCGDYERLWTTTSLRGLIGATLEVRVLSEGVHSGTASGVVPDTFRIARRLLDRVEDAATGRVLVPELWTDVPPERTAEIRAVAADLGGALTSSFPYVDGAGPAIAADEPAAQLTAKTWEPTLTIIGADGLPPTQTAGNVLRPSTTLALSFRLPPRVDAQTAGRAVERLLTDDPPHGATVTVRIESAEDGWDAPATAPWLAQAMDRASEATFGRPARSVGEGGSIPFMAMLGDRFPAAQFLLAGVLGPESNAHGPNEFLHLPTARKLTAAVALVLDAHAER